MEKTQHSLIVGDDATRFAVGQGFDETSLTNGASLDAWQKWKDQGEKSNAWDPEPFAGDTRPVGHDTVGTMAVDMHGNVCVGCSTNGRTFKLPGRVGDSPITGAGAYCDNDVGAAIATGNGDVMMRFLPHNILCHGIDVGRTDREGSVALLPMKITQLNLFGLYPFR